MIEISKKEECCGCYGCYNICPQKCITMNIDEEGFWYPQVDKSKCIECNLCTKICPTINTLTRGNKEIFAYACKNKDEKVRMTSSSGGVFTLLCEEVIRNGGVVFGAAFDEDFNVIHKYATSLSECIKFKGSKYVQSSIGNAYNEVQNFLKEGKLVLFSGTPCQISGLYSFLRKDYENLILVDVACHGVPSPLVFKKYLEDINRDKKKIVAVSFRDKSTGWASYSFKVTFDDGEFKERGNDNSYIKGFIKDLYLRPSCYECQFKKPNCTADITLADYWGVQGIHPNFSDEKGISLVLIHTKKGRELMACLQEKMSIIETNMNYSFKHNPSIISNAKKNKKREVFFSTLNNGDLSKSIRKYSRTPIYKRIYGKVIHIYQKARG